MSAVILLLVTFFAPAVHGFQTYNTGSGTVYKLGVKQDVTLERGSSNFNYLEYLIVSKHPGYPNKRSLVQFEDLPSTCPTLQIESAKMYLYYEYAHKASGSSVSQVPFIPRYLEVYLVRKPWNEVQTTSTIRLSGTPWSAPWLGLDGTDAEATPQQGTVIIFPYRPKGFIEFDVTNAVRSWSTRVANNGLVIRATNELDPGRDIRFASNAMSDSTKHAFVLVRCTKEEEYRITAAPSSTPHYHHSIYTIPYQKYTMPDETRPTSTTPYLYHTIISERKHFSSASSSITPYHTSTYTTPHLYNTMSNKGKLFSSAPSSITPYHTSELYHTMMSQESHLSSVPSRKILYYTKIYTTPYPYVTLSEEKRLNSAPLSMTPCHTSNYISPYQKFTVREETTWSISSTTSKHLSVAAPCCKDDDEPRRQVQKHGSGSLAHKRSSMVFFSAFLVSIVRFLF